MTASMDDLTPAERVLSGGRPDLVAYRERIVRSTTSHHGDALEAALRVACIKHRQLNDAYVAYLRGGGKPGGQNKSRRWGEAEHAYTGALEVVAAAFSVLYPKTDGTPPFTEVEALIEYRVGPLCTGWLEGNEIVHAVGDTTCPQHPAPGR